MKYQEESYVYQVHSNYGSCIFDSEKDGINALWLVALYHDITIDKIVAQEALKKQGFCEQYWPCTIERCDKIQSN